MGSTTRCLQHKLNGIGDSMKMFFKIWKVVLKVAFFPTMMMLLLVFSSGLISGALTYTWNLLFQEVYNFLTINTTLKKLIFYGGIIAGLYVGNYLSRIILSFMRPNFLEKIRIAVVSNIHQNVSLIPMEYYESTKTYDDIYMANNFVNSPHFMIFFFGSISIINTIISLASTIVALALFSSWLIAIAILSIIPLFILRIVRGKKYFQLQTYQAPDLRFQGYLFSLFTDVHSLREMRCYGFEEYLENRWQELKTTNANHEQQFMKKTSFYQFGADLFKTSGLIIAIILITYLAFNNLITIGQFGISLITFRNVQSSFHSILSQLSQIASKTPYVSKLVMFYDKTNEFRKNKKNEFTLFSQGIYLENVSFAYPACNNNALENINLHIKKGELVAIVGQNGAGKTTLVKVLMGLFKPTTGTVYYDGVDTKEYKTTSLTNDTSAVFQNFTRYALSIRENVAISDVDNIFDDYKIISCLKKVDLTDLLIRCDYNLDQLLRKDFGGLELSGGEWQKLAIARGVFKDSNLIIFDEPTASIDPILENKIFAVFKELTKDRTSVLVSHRIGPTRLADKIIVLDGGRIVEEGTFDELMQRKGKYYELYTLQSKWYQE